MSFNDMSVMAALDYSNLLIPVLITFILAMVWDKIKMRQDVINREKSIQIALKTEIINNLLAIMENRNYLKNDTKYRETKNTKSFSAGVLIPYRNKMLDSFSTNFPYHLMGPEIIPLIIILSTIIDQTNEFIKDRSNHQDYNMTNPDYNKIILEYNKIIINKSNSIENDLKKLQEKVNIIEIIIKADEYGIYYKNKERNDNSKFRI